MYSDGGGNPGPHKDTLKEGLMTKVSPLRSGVPQRPFKHQVSLNNSTRILLPHLWTTKHVDDRRFCAPKETGPHLRLPDFFPCCPGPSWTLTSRWVLLDQLLAQNPTSQDVLDENVKLRALQATWHGRKCAIWHFMFNLCPWRPCRP